MEKRLVLQVVVVSLAVWLLNVPVMAQMGKHPCEETTDNIKIGEPVGSTRWPSYNLTKWPSEEKYFRLGEEVSLGENITVRVNVTVQSGSSNSITLTLYRSEGQGYVRIAGNEFILSKNQSRETIFRWFEGVRPSRLCIRVAHFPSSDPRVTAVTKAEFSIQSIKQRDYQGIEAPPSYDKNPVDLGLITMGKTVTVNGSLSYSSKVGIDYFTAGNDIIDFYAFSVVLGKGRQLVVTLNTSTSNNYEVAIVEIIKGEEEKPQEYTLRYKQTAQTGRATLVLVNDEPVQKNYYLKISNYGGLGGAGPYYVTMTVREVPTQTVKTEDPTRQNRTQRLEQVNVSPETAQLIVYSTAIGVAAAAVAGAVISVRRRRSEIVVEEEW